MSNYLPFGQVGCDFVSGINVFVGENGTGKSIALKTIYSMLYTGMDLETRALGPLRNLLRILPAQSSHQLLRHGEEKGTVFVGLSNRDGWLLDLPPKLLDEPAVGSEVSVDAVFIPAMEIFGKIRNLSAMLKVNETDFDPSFPLLADRITAGKSAVAGEFRELAGVLEDKVLLGQIEQEPSSGRYFLRQGTVRTEMPLVAEGIRKFATLTSLIQRGWIRPGTVLLWDEPEVNLNPVLMDELVEALLALARKGVQIFLATHSYIILEELAHASKPGEVRYFGFEKGDDGVAVKAADDLPSLAPNPILRQYEELLLKKAKRAMEQSKKP